jgi:hypothetical protein
MARGSSGRFAQPGALPAIHRWAEVIGDEMDLHEGGGCVVASRQLLLAKISIMNWFKNGNLRQRDQIAYLR